MNTRTTQKDVRGAGREKHRRSSIQMYCKTEKVFKNFGINNKSWKGVLQLKKLTKASQLALHCTCMLKVFRVRY